MGLMYDSDTFNVKKGFDDLYNTIAPEETMLLEDYAKEHYDPGFKIENTQRFGQ